MKTKLVGDIHGNIHHNILTKKDHRVIQLGDFGLGFGQSDFCKFRG